MYDLNTLVHLLKQPANYQWMSYVISAREAGIPQVAFPDRKVRLLSPCLRGISAVAAAMVTLQLSPSQKLLGRCV